MYRQDPSSPESTHAPKNRAAGFKRSEADVISSQPSTVNRYLNSTFEGAQDVKIDNSHFQNVGKQINNYGGTYGASIPFHSFK
jgi:hypothetical protein